MPLTPERVAFEARLKPALRLAVRAGEEVAAIARERAAVASEAVHGRVFIYVAGDLREAERLRDCEAPYLPGAPSQSAGTAMFDAHRTLGLALGYPACCTDAFVARLKRDVRRARDGGLAHEDFVAAEDALSRSTTLHGLLDATPLDRGPTIVSFYPCAFDCAAALALATAIAAAFAKVEPSAAAARRTALSAAVAIARDGSRTPPASAPTGALVLDRWIAW